MIEFASGFAVGFIAAAALTAFLAMKAMGKLLGVGREVMRNVK
jgi:hypothetical protein